MTELSDKEREMSLQRARAGRLLSHQIAGMAHLALAHSGKLPEDVPEDIIHPKVLKRMLAASKNIHISDIADLSFATGLCIRFGLTEASPVAMTSADLGLTETGEFIANEPEGS